MTNGNSPVKGWQGPLTLGAGSLVWGFGAGVMGVLLPLLAHVAHNAEHFWQPTLLIPRIVVPHAILLLGGVVLGIGWWQCSRMAQSATQRSIYILWEGVLPWLLIAVLGAIEKVIRRSGYQLAEVQGGDLMQLLVLRVVLWSMGGYFLGSLLWKARRVGDGTLTAA